MKISLELFVLASFYLRNTKDPRHSLVIWVKRNKIKEEFSPFISKPALKVFQVILEERKSDKLLIQTIWLLSNILYIYSTNEIIDKYKNDEETFNESIELNFDDKEVTSYTEKLMIKIVESLNKILIQRIESKSNEGMLLLQLTLLCLNNISIGSQKLLAKIYDSGVLKSWWELISIDTFKKFNDGIEYLLCTTRRLIYHADDYIIENSLENGQTEMSETIQTIDNITKKWTSLFWRTKDYKITAELLYTLSVIAKKSERFVRIIISYDIFEKLIKIIDTDYLLSKYDHLENCAIDDSVYKNAFILISIICSAESVEYSYIKKLIDLGILNSISKALYKGYAWSKYNEKYYPQQGVNAWTNLFNSRTNKIYSEIVYISNDVCWSNELLVILHNLVNSGNDAIEEISSRDGIVNFMMDWLKSEEITVKGNSIDLLTEILK